MDFENENEFDVAEFQIIDTFVDVAENEVKNDNETNVNGSDARQSEKWKDFERQPKKSKK